MFPSVLGNPGRAFAQRALETCLWAAALRAGLYGLLGRGDAHSHEAPSPYQVNQLTPELSAGMGKHWPPVFISLVRVWVRKIP